MINGRIRRLGSRKRTKLLGDLGEHYVMFKLAQRGIRSQKMDACMGFDILTWDGIRIEVKTSPLKKTYQKKHKATQECWQFANHRIKVKSENGARKITFIKTDRNCDFFIFICLDKKFNIAKTFIVPKEVIGTRRAITIPKEFKRKVKFSLKDYEDQGNFNFIFKKKFF